MGRLGRFLKLERARPDDVPAETDARSSLRFQAIEPRKNEPPTPDDRFAPPREHEAPLEIVHDHAPEADRAKEQRRARAEAELAELARERAELAVVEPQRAPPWMQRPAVHALARMTTTSRVIVLGTSVLVIGVLAQLVGPVAWGLLPIVAAVIIGSHYLHSS